MNEVKTAVGSWRASQVRDVWMMLFALHINLSELTYEGVVFPPGFALLRQSAKSNARHCSSLTPPCGKTNQRHAHVLAGDRGMCQISSSKNRHYIILHSKSKVRSFRPDSKALRHKRLRARSAASGAFIKLLNKGAIQHRMIAVQINVPRCFI